MPSRVRRGPRIRPAAHTSSRHALRACTVQQHDCFFPPIWCYVLLLGTVAVAMASSRHQSPRPRCLAHEFPARAAGSQELGFRLSEVICPCVALALLCPSFTLLPHACPADLVVADSHAATRPLSSGPVPSHYTYNLLTPTPNLANILFMNRCEGSA